MPVATEFAESSSLALLDGLPDSDLLDAWTRDRHAASLATLVDRYSVMVLSVCRRRCRSEADAEDAFQTTFLYLARNASKIRHAERLPGWLHRVAQRSAVATLKPIQRQSEPMVEPPVDPDDPLDRLARRHEAIVLDEELSELPEHYRAAIVLHIYEGHSIQGLADRFGTTTGSIRGRLQRGKKLLAQRLRHRGVVPVLAFAAAGTWTVSTSQAAKATEGFTDSLADGGLPDSPIDPSLLESLLAQGARLMPSVYATASLLAGSALVALLMMTDGTFGQTSNQRSELLLASTIESQPQRVAGADVVSVESSLPVPSESKAVLSQGQTSAAANTAAGGVATAKAVSGTAGMNADQLTWAERPMMPEPTSEVARQVIRTLAKPVDLNIRSTLADLPQILGPAAEIPVLLDQRGIEFAEAGNRPVAYQGQGEPLQTALRRMLRPLGLKAVVENEGLVITADPAILVHKGIGTARWINIEEEAEKKIAEKLDTKASFQFYDVPLEEFANKIAADHGLTILIDRRALEEIGLSGEEPISIAVEGVKLRSMLRIALRELDLTYTVIGESLMLTTIEAAEHQLAARIYWLEGTGVAKGDYQAFFDLVQSTIVPDTWEALGGPSTMAPVSSTRPAIAISTIYPIHERIEQLLQNLRDSHFGEDPVLESVQVPKSQQRGMMGGGGMGGGGGMF